MLAALQAPAANPCEDPALQLRCPDLVAFPPTSLSVERTPRGRELLRMKNRIVNVGAGPAELLAVRTTEYGMRARQVIFGADGRRHRYDTGARVAWTSVPSRGGSYWKWAGALRMELWSLDPTGRVVGLRRISPKLNYCLRDLQRLRLLPGSPASPVFGACNQRAGQQSVTLGTSVGWADIYPASYPGNYVDVTGLQGCFAIGHRVDPNSVVFESNETNNLGIKIVRLPYRPGRQGCP